MHSRMQLQLLKLCLLYNIVLPQVCASAMPQLHPKFQARLDSESMEPFPATLPADSSGLAWIPTTPSTFYHTSRRNSFTLQVTIENAPNNGDLQIALSHLCIMEENYSTVTLNTDIEICRTIKSGVSIGIKNTLYMDSSTIRITIVISLSRVLDDAEDRLNNSIYLKFAFIFRRQNFRMETSVIKIIKWNNIGRLYRTDGLFALTEPAKDALFQTSNASLNGFHSVPLFGRSESLFYYRNAEFEKYLLSFGALLQYNTGSFMFQEKHLRVMTMNYPYEINSLDLTTMRVVITGSTQIMLHYSRVGLRRAIAQLLKEYNRNVCRNSMPNGCVVIFGCTLLMNILLPIELENCQIRLEVDKLTYSQAVTDPQPGECKAVDDYPTTIVIFAGVPYTVTCPIICSELKRPFAFFKDAALIEAGVLEEFKSYVLPSGVKSAVRVHRSGAAIVFGRSATYADSGEYKCVAGVSNTQATFRVEVVALPVFNVSGSELVGGYLPPKIYLLEGDKYSVNCTVFHAGMKAVTLAPRFFVVTNRLTQDWSTINQQDFVNLLAAVGSRVDISITNNSFSTTLALTVDKVPQVTDRYDFSHRFVCFASVSTDDIQRFGLPSYETESGSDVLVLQREQLRPVPEDFMLTGGNCCREKCPAEKCSFEISLKPSNYEYLVKVGIKVRGEFVPWISGQPPEVSDWIRKSTEFSMDKDTANLKWRMSEDLDKLSMDKKAAFFGLVAVFTFVNPTAKWGGIPAKLRIDRCRSRNCAKSGAACSSDPSCVFSTATDPALTSPLSIGQLLGLRESFLFVNQSASVSDQQRKGLYDDKSAAVVRPLWPAAVLLVAAITTWFLC